MLFRSEDIPKGLHDPNEERWQDYDVRRYAYWSVFAGSFDNGGWLKFSYYAGAYQDFKTRFPMVLRLTINGLVTSIPLAPAVPDANEKARNTPPITTMGIK